MGLERERERDELANKRLISENVGILHTAKGHSLEDFGPEMLLSSHPFKISPMAPVEPQPTRVRQTSRGTVFSHNTETKSRSSLGDSANDLGVISAVL